MSTAFDYLRFFAVILEVLLIFNLVIIVHELGHFLAARWRGAKVEEFGVWFGKPIWRKKIGEVWYSLGSIPAGGFVKLPQMAPMETLEGESDTPKEELAPLGPIDKMIVAVAGPLFSFLLALTLGCVTWLVGTPTSQPDLDTRIGSVNPGGPADIAGLKRGDKILAIDGNPVSRFSGPTKSVMWYIVSSQGDKIEFLIERDGEQKKISSGFTREDPKDPNPSKFRRRPMRKVMIGPLFEPYVDKVDEKSAAAAAGLKHGDVVLTANGVKIISLDQLVDVVKKGYTAPLELVVQRGEATVPVTLPPLAPKEGKAPDEIAGVEWGRFISAHPTPMVQVADSVRAIRNMIGAALSPKGDIGPQSFSGPIGIMSVYKRMLETEDGWRLAIAFSVFFNVNLALVNMLPFPVLDGGHITLAIIEGIRRRPVNARALEILQTGCALLLVGFILFVSFFDVGDLLPKSKATSIPQIEQKPTVIESAPSSATPAPVP
ncbi:MAG TPA: RIP metalloprotease RseP [Chthoniobacteraceae bacterium]|jgi:regulator of sigma E protease|nr:RIP metalloprotease RseP [Chthoniobacteraceae bacterium]